VDLRQVPGPKGGRHEAVIESLGLLEEWAERAAILEYDAGYSREQAEQLAAEMGIIAVGKQSGRLRNQVNQAPE
jgi:hypothetical protein